MAQANSERGGMEMNRERRFSFYFIAGSLVLIGWQHLAVPLLAILFAYLALTKLHFLKRRGKWVAVALFLFLLAAMAYALTAVVNQAVQTLPQVAEEAIPKIIQWAKAHNIELPFTDFDSLKDVAMDSVKSEAHYLASVAKIARGATTQVVFFLIGCVVAISIFLHPQLELDRKSTDPQSNLYSACCDEIAARFATLYLSFEMVMGAQIVISVINTVLTGIFVLIVHLPHTLVVIGLTFLCGLLPVIGNLISNSIIVGIAFTVSPERALIALGFLVLVHKLEYFLNGKIIGGRIRNPLWLTLLGLVLGERLMGIPGMILAPVVLHYIKVEASQIRARNE